MIKQHLINNTYQVLDGGNILLQGTEQECDRFIALRTIINIAEESWEGCDGCTENDKYFWKKGFQVGYNRTKTEEISDEEIEQAAKDYHRNNGVYYGQVKTFIDAIQWYREQLKKKQ